MSRSALFATCALLAASCGGTSSLPRASEPAIGEAPLWVLAPHPDDEALFGAEPIRRALREHREVSVFVMTNGDLGCERDGYLRERETAAALAVLGLDESRVHFLGYPDGYLDALGATPLPPRERRDADGRCVLGATTYAARGAEHTDVHTALTGAPADYTAANAIGDLAAWLERERPSDVYVAHPIDEHPDHATTYVLLRRALESARLVSLPRLHRALVHVGGCWPNGDRLREPCEQIDGVLGKPHPPLPGALARYVPTERLVVEDGGALARRAIAQYRSQLHVDADHDWLGAFARGDAIAWPEALVREGDRVVRAPAQALIADEARWSVAPHALDASEGTTLEGELASSGGRFEISLEVTVPREGAVTLELAPRDAEGLGVRLGPNALVVSHGTTELRDVYVPDASAGPERWTFRVDPRPDEGGVIELEIRRDGALVAVAIDPIALEGARVIRASASGGASVARVDLRAL
ncbi:MAG: PIG-L family deacetylase [Deltaproteobacteria bacterium]|nr:PIG-L family deacetylase [Deltaproteobacteria bacterium]